MRTTRWLEIVVAANATLLAGTASGGIVYTESVDGDLSDNRFAPTARTLCAGSNVLTGTFGPSGVPDVPDLDYITITIPTGYQLAQIVLLVSDVGGAFSFIGVELGPIISVPWDKPDPAGLLGWSHYGSADAGSNLLPAIGQGSGAIGFSGALPANAYTIWLMELDGAQPYNYSFDFVVTPVPAPATLGVLAAFTLSRRRARR